ncbi:hypothetical protein SAMN05444320_102299 [Streptoalloteichus hindustanus]|uniref:Uncharacterized protein n=1 Tax=Streptoalloteichus hindustanus TaxID=2017 RepID=A0A1M4YBL2_STRHI|nr:hypothetical protein SAMN05444320_102299 [Streptoalloteichus hindustanus]
MGAEHRLARAHGVFNVLAGLWPLVSMRSFEWVFGPKADRWLEHTVAGLLITTGCAQLRAADGAPELARALGVGAAGTLLAVDLVYVPLGRLRPTYLLDAAMEIAWIVAWARRRRGVTGYRSAAGRTGVGCWPAMPWTMPRARRSWGRRRSWSAVRATSSGSRLRIAVAASGAITEK